MKQQFPTDRHEQRRVFLAAVDSIRDILAANADEAEAMRTLPPASVTALRESGLFALMLPTELGGAETDPMTQLEVFEAVSFIDPATGWSYAIGASALSFSAYLPNAAIARMFAGGRTPINPFLANDPNAKARRLDQPVGPLAGAQTAGWFLQEFIQPGTEYVHLDIAGTFLASKAEKYYSQPGATGTGSSRSSPTSPSA